jgi:hypothetical protein
VRGQQTARDYLGASRLGVACERALQFEYAKAPVDHGRDTQGRMLRIFERGHVMEDCMVAWLRDAGFDLRTRRGPTASSSASPMRTVACAVTSTA